jgi:hypothetical protein
MKKYCIGSRRREYLHKIKRRKADWIGHILRRNFFPNHVIEGKIGGGKDRSDGKTRKKMEAATG